jgi:hypothetical protein
MLAPRTWQLLFAVAHATLVEYRLKQEWSPSTPRESSHRVHVVSGHRGTQAEDDMDPAGA